MSIRKLGPCEGGHRIHLALLSVNQKNRKVEAAFSVKEKMLQKEREKAPEGTRKISVDSQSPEGLREEGEPLH